MTSRAPGLRGVHLKLGADFPEALTAAAAVGVSHEGFREVCPESVMHRACAQAFAGLSQAGYNGSVRLAKTGRKLTQGRILSHVDENFKIDRYLWRRTAKAPDLVV